MVGLEEIKEYFGNSCKIFPKSDIAIYSKLSSKTKTILYEVGIPNYKGYGGEYIVLDKLRLIDNKYLQFAKESFFENYLRCIDLETGNIFNINTYPDNSIEKYTINSDLESYLKYVYIYDRFRKEIKIPEELGDYDENHSKYAKELKKRLLQVNNDVNDGSWANLIEEMDLGVI